MTVRRSGASCRRRARRTPGSAPGARAGPDGRRWPRAAGRVALDALVGDEPVEQRANRDPASGAVAAPWSRCRSARYRVPGPGRASCVRAAPGGRDRAAAARGRRHAGSSARARARGRAAPPARRTRGANRRRRRVLVGHHGAEAHRQDRSTAAAMRRTVASWPRTTAAAAAGGCSIRPTTRWNPRPARTSRRSRRASARGRRAAVSHHGRRDTRTLTPGASAERAGRPRTGAPTGAGRRDRHRPGRARCPRTRPRPW